MLASQIMGKSLRVIRRAALVLGVVAVLVVSAVPLLTGSFASVTSGQSSSSGVCDRTAAVRDALVAASPADTCGDVTNSHLRDVLTLNLGGQSITSLSAGDFDGLHRLDTLDLSDNSLTSLPAGLFDELFLLRVLRLHDNQLATLPADIFDQLFLLEELTLHDNAMQTLPDGMFDDLSRFDGVLSSQDVQGLNRIKEFLDDHEPATPEEFINALTDLHKERFIMVYQSSGLGAEHISDTHPRVISWGANGEYVFGWITNPDAPDKFRLSVEFLIPSGAEWTAGIIDFSGDEPQIVQPAICQTCHGVNNKPLFPGFDWGGTEYFHSASDSANKIARMREHIYSTNPSIEPMHLDRPEFSYGDHQRLFSPSSGDVPYEFPAEEASKTLALRHAEVLLARLKQLPDYPQFAEDSVCASNPDAAIQNRFFESREHTLGLFPNSTRLVGDVGSDLTPPLQYYHYRTGSLDQALLFLVLHDLWSTHPEIRDTYRATVNTDAAAATGNYLGSIVTRNLLLMHPPGEATAEDELIQLYRLHFGYGNRAMLNLADSHAAPPHQNGHYLVDFKSAHTGAMAPRVCSTLRAMKDSAPRNVSATHGQNGVTINWQAPDSTENPTGYSVWRSTDGNPSGTSLANKTATVLTHVDTTAKLGKTYFYGVQAINSNGKRYTSDLVKVAMPADPNGPQISSASSFTVDEGKTSVATLAATDADTEQDSLTWWIPTGSAGGADPVHFTLTSGGELSFTAAKDFENPDDADTDGVYKVTVAVSDGAATDTADLTITLRDLNDRPTAAAGDDQESIEPGATVTLTGTGTDPDANDTLTYAWTQTGGTSVTLSDAAVASPTFTAPTGLAEDTTLTFTLRVTDVGGLHHEDEVSVTLSASAINSPATGAPTISGTAQVGETLTASTSGIADTDGLDNATFSYQWVRNDGTTDTDISGATGSTYTLVDADEGKTIKVKVTFTDDANNKESLTSAATATVAAKANTPATGAPTISGTAQVGETLTASTSGIADTDGLTNASFSYQWVRNDGTTDTDISGATGSTYTLVDADEGKTIKVKVTFTDDASNEESVTSTATATVAARANSPATGNPPSPAPPRWARR